MHKLDVIPSFLKRNNLPPPLPKKKKVMPNLHKMPRLIWAFNYIEYIDTYLWEEDVVSGVVLSCSPMPASDLFSGCNYNPLWLLFHIATYQLKIKKNNLYTCRSLQFKNKKFMKYSVKQQKISLILFWQKFVESVESSSFTKEIAKK